MAVATGESRPRRGLAGGRRVHVGGAALGLGILAGGAVAVGGWAGGGMLAALSGVGLVCAVDEPTSVLLFVLALIFVDRSPVVVHQSYVRLYQIFSLPICVKWALLRIGRRERVIVPRGWLWPLLWIATFGLAWPHLISRTNFFVELVGMGYLLLLGVVVGDVVARHHILTQAVDAMTWSGLLVTGSGLVQYGLFLAHVLHPVTYGGFVRPYGFMREPDWYAVVCGLTVVLLLHRRTRWPPGVYRALLVAAVAGLLASLARAAWLATAAAVLVLALAPGPDRTAARRLIAAVVLSLAGGAVLLSLVDGGLMMKLLGRLTPLASGQAAAAHELAAQAWASRLGSLQLMWSLFTIHPWTGNGAGVMGKLSLAVSMDRLYAGGGALNTGRAAANVFLSQMASVGVAGLVPFLLWLGSALRGGFRQGTWLGAVLVLCLIDFQFNSGTGFGFFWVFMALAGISDQARQPEQGAAHVLRVP
ncbi:MAG: hypothetical protein M0Z53_07745 [Thermaerobacter sp.]|nr:hypothetical protein [Thermaerobacter sp.]